MESITISKLNETFIQLNGSSGVLQELSALFTFDVPNARFMPSVRNKMWDGRIRLLGVGGPRTLYLGLHPYVKQYCDQEGYECTYEDPLDTETEFSVVEARKMFAALRLSTMIDGVRTDIKIHDHQERAIIHAIQGRRSLLLSPTSCHAPGTQVIMFDGSLKTVEEIKEGDLLMGPDSTPRKVLRLHTGDDEMFRIIPFYGDDFVVNGEHLLSLVHTNEGKKNAPKPGSIATIRVRDYQQKSKYFKHVTKLYHSECVEFPDVRNEDIIIEPYFLGLMLGDGNSTGAVGITTLDREVVEENYRQAEIFSCDVREASKTNTKAKTYFFSRDGGTLNWLLFALKNLGVFPTLCELKHIPERYKTASVKRRLELLAGLIDSDGHYSSAHHYEISAKSQRLADDVLFLARSLGFHASKKPKIVNGTVYFRLYISGAEMHRIPVRIPRKKAPQRKRRTEALRSSFTIVSEGVGRYYGFELDRDQLYLLHDFTVSHNSGKSLILYCLLRYYLAVTKGKILIIVPSVGLVKQLFDDFADYSFHDRWSAEANCHMVYSGQLKDVEKRVLISTWQSLYKQPTSFFDKFDVAFGDEVHLFAAKEVSTLMARLTNARFRHGTTGTLAELKTNQMVLEGLFGPVYRTITTRELMDDHKVADLMIKCLQLQYPPADRKQMKKAAYKDEIDFLIAHPGRNRFIRNLALSLKGNVLILFQYVDKHGKILDRMISERNEGGRPTYFVCGETEADVRNDVRKIVETETEAIITASYGVFSTGVSIRNINYVIFASPTKSKIRVMQSIGRGLRISGRKNSVVLFDIADDMTVFTKKGTTAWENYSLLHFLERIKYYNSEEFDYKLYKIDLAA